LKGLETYTEQELVASLKQRNQAAFSYLYDHYANALNGVILNIIPDQAIASDVLQEIFVKIWRHVDAYDQAKGKLFTWMYQIARSTSIDMVRSKDWKNNQRNNPLTEDNILQAGTTTAISEEIGLRRIVNTLKEDQKVLVDLSYFQGYTQEEIAKMLGIPLGTVKTRLRAALIYLRQKINL
jgi:RNA polymerase sigma-70 factor, ECF subfamily